MEAQPERSPLGEALAAVGDRWTLLIVEALLDGSLRFGELEAAVEGIAPNILTQRLRRLEQEGLVVAHPYSERPRRFVYELTEGGRELAGALRLLSQWGARHSDAEPVRHRLRHRARGPLVLPDVRGDRRGPRRGRPLRVNGPRGPSRLMARGRLQWARAAATALSGEVAERLKAAAC